MKNINWDFEKEKITVVFEYPYIGAKRRKVKGAKEHIIGSSTIIRDARNNCFKGTPIEMSDSSRHYDDYSQHIVTVTINLRDARKKVSAYKIFFRISAFDLMVRRDIDSLINKLT